MEDVKLFLNKYHIISYHIKDNIFQIAREFQHLYRGPNQSVESLHKRKYTIVSMKIINKYGTQK